MSMLPEYSRPLLPIQFSPPMLEFARFLPCRPICCAHAPVFTSRPRCVRFAWCVCPFSAPVIFCVGKCGCERDGPRACTFCLTTYDAPFKPAAVKGGAGGMGGMGGGMPGMGGFGGMCVCARIFVCACVCVCVCVLYLSVRTLIAVSFEVFSNGVTRSVQSP